MKKRSVGALIIGSAIIWGLVILGCAYKLRGTGCYQEISTILIGGVVAHLILNWAPIALLLKKGGNGKV